MPYINYLILNYFIVLYNFINHVQSKRNVEICDNENYLPLEIFDGGNIASKYSCSLYFNSKGNLKTITFHVLTESEGLANNIKKYQSTVAASTSHHKVALADFHIQKHHHSGCLRGNVLAPRETFRRIASHFNRSCETRTAGNPSAALRSSSRKRNLYLHRHGFIPRHWLSDRSHVEFAGNHLHRQSIL